MPIDPVKAALEVAVTGPIRGNMPGREDVHEISVPGESFVCPADCVSALGQGNTEAGYRVLQQLYPPVPPRRANGGDVGKVPIVAAGGEYIIDPSHVARIGGGDMKKGHAALREAMHIIRQKHISTLKRLPKTARG